MGDYADWDDTYAVMQIGRSEGGSSNDVASNAPASEMPYTGAGLTRLLSGRQTNPVVTGDTDSEKWAWGDRANWWHSNDRWSGH